MEDSNKAISNITNSKLKQITSQVISIFIELGCFLFVFVQTYQCVSKFVKDPQGTEIRIVEGYKETYPDITICPIDESSFVQILEKCNLTYESYFIDGNWVGNGPHDFCTDPERLFDEMTNPAFEDFKMTYNEFDAPFYYYAEDFKNKDWDEFGRCKTFVFPSSVKNIWELKFESNLTTYQIIISRVIL